MLAISQRACQYCPLIWLRILLTINELYAAPDEMRQIESDFAQLAQLAIRQSPDDVRLLLGRLVRKYRSSHPELAAQLDQSLKNSNSSAASGGVLRAHSPPRTGIKEDRSPDDELSLRLIRVVDDRGNLAPPLLSEALCGDIDTLIKERLQRDRLKARGISPTKSAMLVGPPGVGKTLSARWIASELKKPLWILDLSMVMSSLLGRTGANLRDALNYAKANNAVLLLDEVDAIGKRRNDDSDVGELKRLVTVMLQEIDHWPDTSLLLAATNHPELVDVALWRRFDVIFSFSYPENDAIREAIDRFLGADAKRFGDWNEVLAASFTGYSLSDVERAIVGMRRAAVIHETEPGALATRLASAYVDRLARHERVNVAVELAKLGRSHHEIHRLTGVARETIRKHVGPSPRKGRGQS